MVRVAVRHGAALVGVAALAFVACGGAGPSVRAENTRLRAEVSELRNRARADRRRIRDLKNEILKLKSALAQGAAAEVTVPPLPIEVVTPEPGTDTPIAAAPAPEAAETEPDVILLTNLPRRSSARPQPRRSRAPVPRALRPRERLPVTSGRVPTLPAAESKPAATAPAPARDKSPEPKIEPPAADAPRAVASETSPEVDPNSARAAYKRYLSALFAGNHTYAIAGFKNFIARHPDHKYADNAQYWLGEAYYDKREYKAALAAFEAVIDRYPRGNKVPDARLKIGYCHLKLGDKGRARRAFSRLVESHPRSAPARLAREELKALGENR